MEIPATDEQLDKVFIHKAFHALMFFIEGFVRINESDMYLYPDLDTWQFSGGDENGSVASDLRCLYDRIMYCF